MNTVVDLPFFSEISFISAAVFVLLPKNSNEDRDRFRFILRFQNEQMTLEVLMMNFLQNVINKLTTMH